MIPSKKIAILAILLIVALTILFAGCAQEGCTDQTALNYNSAATADNGTCLYCKTTSLIGESAQLALADTNYNSGFNSFYGDTVVRFTISTNYVSYNNSKCGANFCNVSGKVFNLTNATVVFNCEFITTSIASDTVISAISIAPKGSYTINSIYTNPSSSACPLPSITVIPLTNFSYH
jgi:hypothetical protein